MAYKMNDSADIDKKLKAAFRLFDKNGDGTISTQEVRDLMLVLGERARTDDINRLMKEMDINGDGRVDYDEVAEVVTKEMNQGGYSIV